MKKALIVQGHVVTETGTSGRGFEGSGIICLLGKFLDGLCKSLIEARVLHLG
jgi:hypothetical protein